MISRTFVSPVRWIDRRRSAAHSEAQGGEGESREWIRVTVEIHKGVRQKK